MDDIKKNQHLLNLNPRNPLIILNLRKILKNLSNKCKSDLVVHAHLTWPFYYTVLATIGIKHIKLFYTVHGKDRRRKIPFFWIIERFFYSRYKSVICISEGVMKTLLKWLRFKNSKSIVKIYNGSRIFLQKRNKLSINQLPSLISIGSLNYTKNFSTAILAVSKVRDKIKDYLIIGEGPDRLKLETIIKKNNLNDKVKLLGRLENIEKYLYEADIQIIPSKHEGFSLVSVEGMSVGLSIVASNIEGLREVLDPSNVSVTLVDQPDSEKEWSEKINLAINNLNKLGSEMLSNASRSQAEKFSLNKMANSYLQLYRNY